MKAHNQSVLIKYKTYQELRKLLFMKNGDIVKGDILNAVNEAVEQYITREKAEGEKL